jgi:hypothetical protein
VSITFKRVTRCPECGDSLAVLPEDALSDPVHVSCDLCGEVEHPADMTPDWNGETGCHLTCERASAAHVVSDTNDGESQWWWMDLGAEHMADLLGNVAATFAPAYYTGPKKDVPLYGIVSEEHGGIVAYCMDADVAGRIVKALEDH